MGCDRRFGLLNGNGGRADTGRSRLERDDLHADLAGISHPPADLENARTAKR